MSESLIGRAPLFAGLPSDELAALDATLQRTSIPAQTVLFREGDRGDHFYVVLDGQIAILKAMDSPDERLLALRGTGDFVGEMSLLNWDGLRSASARVQTDVDVLIFTRAEFDALLHRQPTLVYEMLRVVSTRLRQAQDAAIHDLQEKNRRLEQAYADLQAAQAQIIEKETLERELRLACEIQQSMLPQTLPHMPGLDLGARMLPARIVGGDFYDVVALDSDRLGIAIGDVAGKGMPAALFMALTCSLLRAEAARLTSPEKVLQRVNQHLLGMNAAGMFVTVLYGILDRATREFAYVRAGHELPLIWDMTGTILTPAHGIGHPLAFFPDPLLDVQTVCLPPGGALLLYTDGVTEAMDTQGALFELSRLQAFVCGSQATSAQGLCDDLVQVLMTYHGASPQADDITVLAVRTS